MQLGMIGLGRMGANMVRRLIKGGHDCAVFDMSPKAVAELVKEKAVGAASLADLVDKLAQPRALWLMVPAAAVDSTIAALLPLLAPGDILIDGGNSLLRRRHSPRAGTRAQRHPLRRRRHQRRRVGTGARLLHDDRRRGRDGASISIRFSRDSRPASATSNARLGGRMPAAAPSRATCTAARTAPATSSKWSTTASSTA